MTARSPDDEHRLDLAMDRVIRGVEAIPVTEEAVEVFEAEFDYLCDELPPRLHKPSSRFLVAIRSGGLEQLASRSDCSAAVNGSLLQSQETLSRRQEVHRPRSNRGRRTWVALCAAAIAAILFVGLLLVLHRTSGPEHGLKKTTSLQPVTPRGKFAAYLLEAESAGDKDDKALALFNAIYLLREHQFTDADVSVRELWQRVVDVDPEQFAAFASFAAFEAQPGVAAIRGGPSPEDQLRMVKEEKVKRWTKDAFARRVRRVADFFIEDVARVPDVDLEFFFDTSDVPKPFLLMVQRSRRTDSGYVALTSRVVGKALAALQKQIRAEYGERLLANWAEEQVIVPVMIFEDGASYERYRDNGHKNWPASGVAGATYVSSMPLNGIDDICRGTLYVWNDPNRSKPEFHAILRAATQQIMHNAAQMDRRPRTPWLQEGLAEFWATHERTHFVGLPYKFRRFSKARFAAVSANAQAYFDWKARNDPKAPRNWISLKQLLDVSPVRFDLAKARLDENVPTAADVMIVQSVRALGWAFCFWSHYGPGKRSNGEVGRYIGAFQKVVGYELRDRLDRDRLAKCYGINSDEDWEKLNDDFMFFCLRRMRAWNNGIALPELPKAKRY